MFCCYAIIPGTPATRCFPAFFVSVKVLGGVREHRVRGFNIIYRITTNEKEPSFSDELDKLIELKATRNSHYVFILGFLLSMGSLVMDMSPSTMFIILFISGFLSELVGVFTQLYLYRKGV
jgi:hypothetical protein